MVGQINHDWLLGERNPHWDLGWKIYFPAFVTVTYENPVEIALLPLDHLVRNCLSWKSSLNVTHYNWGHFCCNHGMSYIITNLTIMAIWRSNGFRIHPHMAEKQGTLLFSGTFGHTVGFCIMLTEPPVTQEIELDCENHNSSQSTSISWVTGGSVSITHNLVACE